MLLWTRWWPAKGHDLAGRVAHAVVPAGIVANRSAITLVKRDAPAFVQRRMRSGRTEQQQP